MSARSVADELVQAAAEAVYAEGMRSRFRLLGDEADHYARVALQAAFAKLPECEAARGALEAVLPSSAEYLASSILDALTPPEAK